MQLTPFHVFNSTTGLCTAALPAIIRNGSTKPRRQLFPTPKSLLMDSKRDNPQLRIWVSVRSWQMQACRPRCKFQSSRGLTMMVVIV